MQLLNSANLISFNTFILSTAHIPISSIVAIMSFMAFWFLQYRKQPSVMNEFSGHFPLASFNLKKFLSLCLLWQTFLKSRGPLFYRLLLNFGLPDVSLWLDSGCAFPDRKPYQQYLLLQSITYGGHKVYLWYWFWSPGQGTVQFSHCTVNSFSLHN